MARIAGVNIPNQKRLEIGLTYIYGIGQPTARKVCAALGLSPQTRHRRPVTFRALLLRRRAKTRTPQRRLVSHRHAVTDGCSQACQASPPRRTTGIR